MSAQRADTQHDPIEVIEYEPVPDPHDGRPQKPEYRERGELLMLQWALEDAR